MQQYRLRLPDSEIHSWDEYEQHTQSNRCCEEEQHRNIAPHHQQLLYIRFSYSTPVHPRVFTKSEVRRNDVELVLIGDGEVTANRERENDL